MIASQPPSLFAEDAPPTHEMVLVASYPTGAQHWRCPQCSRQTVLQHPGPQTRFKMLVLEAGNEQVAHVTASAGMRLASSAPVEFDNPPEGGRLH
jgi:hypothetical protein